MRIRSLALITQLCLAGMVPLAAGCNDDNNEAAGPDANLPVVGTWTATSLMVNGEDLVAKGMIMNVTFDDSGVYVFHVVGDLLGLCGDDTECNITGDWTGTDNEVTLNPGETPTTIDYVTSGDTLTMTGTLAEQPTTIVFQKL